VARRRRERVTPESGSTQTARQPARPRRPRLVHQFLVALCGTEPLVWRRFRCPNGVGRAVGHVPAMLGRGSAMPARRLRWRARPCRAHRGHHRFDAPGTRLMTEWAGGGIEAQFPLTRSRFHAEQPRLQHLHQIPRDWERLQTFAQYVWLCHVLAHEHPHEFHVTVPASHEL